MLLSEYNLFTFGVFKHHLFGEMSKSGEGIEEAKQAN